MKSQLPSVIEIYNYFLANFEDDDSGSVDFTENNIYFDWDGSVVVYEDSDAMTMDTIWESYSYTLDETIEDYVDADTPVYYVETPSVQ